ncbi:MAG TPA: hypothetical protein PKX96_09625, partial [Dysgonamonadaceae bacterium]|nr:hypothetical protein [Dysgonamonadaceae bacterium]
MKSKKFLNVIILILSAFPITGFAQNFDDSGKDFALEQKVDSVLSRMSLEEKVGQMAQFTLDVLGKG